MKILHTADIHLREEGDERWDTLRELIKIGKLEEVDIFVISGDLFNKEIDAERLRPKIREIFSNTGFKIVLIPGNHDKESYKSGMFFGDDVTIFTELSSSFEYQGIEIRGLPFEPIEGEKILNKLLSLKNEFAPNKKNILIYHGHLVDATISPKDCGEEGEERYMPVRLSYFKDLNIKYVLAGHFHSKFDMRQLENGGYFVYPGSPISVTKREIGQRKVNIFEVGKEPKEYALDTHHYKKVVIELDPFRDENPVEVVEKRLKSVHSKASIILTIKGYINSEKIKMSENELAEQIKEITKGKRVDSLNLEFKDIHTILEDDLFKSFMKKLKQKDYKKEKKKQSREVAIKAMMEAKS